MRVAQARPGGQALTLFKRLLTAGVLVVASCPATSSWWCCSAHDRTPRPRPRRKRGTGTPAPRWLCIGRAPVSDDRMTLSEAANRILGLVANGRHATEQATLALGAWSTWRNHPSRAPQHARAAGTGRPGV